MKNDEMKMIQAIFQLHSLIAKGLGDSEQADAIRERMEVLDDQANREQMNTISCYCYALAEVDPELRKRYEELLFADTTDAEDLNKIFQKNLPKI